MGGKLNGSAAADRRDSEDEKRRYTAEDAVDHLADMIDAIRPIYNSMKWIPLSIFCGSAKTSEVRELEDKAGGEYRRIVKTRNEPNYPKALFDALYYLENYVHAKEKKAEAEYKSGSGTQKYTMDDFMAMIFDNTSPGDHDVTRLALLALRTIYNEARDVLPAYYNKNKECEKLDNGMWNADMEKRRASLMHQLNLRTVPKKYLENADYKKAFLGQAPEAKAVAKPVERRRRV